MMDHPAARRNRSGAAGRGRPAALLCRCRLGGHCPLFPGRDHNAGIQQGRHSLGQQWMGRHQLRSPDPEAMIRDGLRGVLPDINQAMKPLPGGQRQQSCDGSVGLAERAEPIAGILTRPRVRGAEIGKKPPWSRQPTVLQVAARDMCQLVTDDESCIATAFTRRDQLARRRARGRVRRRHGELQLVGGTRGLRKIDSCAALRQCVQRVAALWRRPGERDVSIDP